MSNSSAQNDFWSVELIWYDFLRHGKSLVRILAHGTILVRLGTILAHGTIFLNFGTQNRTKSKIVPK